MVRPLLQKIAREEQIALFVIYCPRFRVTRRIFSVKVND